MPYSYTTRPTSFSGLITHDGSTGYAAEAGRYQLYASLACPWSHRALIVRALLGLEQVIGLTLTDPIRDERGWRFPASNGGFDPVTGARYISDLYLATDAGYAGRFTVPCVWDTRTHRIVTNDWTQITVTFETEFRAFHQPGAPDLYPDELRPDIDALGTLIFHAVNNGVYKAGLA
ncbi:MAG TPA: glutathione S-transferase family protein, partial [Streptosporangiaceae bacterium]|nr:glutathione S-transferase family protein [Streptosporangiaceae bacterium]